MWQSCYQAVAGPDATSQPIYSIGAVASIVGISAATLLAWDAATAWSGRRASGRTEALHEGGDRAPQLPQGAHRRRLSAAAARRLLADELSGGHPAAEGAPPDRDSKPRVLIVERDAYAADLAEYLLTTRASLHEPALTPFEITNEGITLANPPPADALQHDGGAGDLISRPAPIRAGPGGSAAAAVRDSSSPARPRGGQSATCGSNAIMLADTP